MHKKLIVDAKIWKEKEERLMKMEMSIREHKIVFVDVYASTDEWNIEIKDAFQDKITEILENMGNRR